MIIKSTISFTVIIFLQLFITTQVYSAETEREAIGYCIAQGAVEPSAFAYCVGKSLAKSEITKCLTGGDCFGKNNQLRKALERAGINFEHINKYGVCGGPNSELRKLFGSGACGCAGPSGRVYIENNTRQTVTFNLEGSCTENESYSLRAGYNVTLSGEGDKWFNIRVSSSGGNVGYAIDSGMSYALELRGNLLDVINITPQYNP